MGKKCYQSPRIAEMKVGALKLMVPSLNVSSGSGLNPTIQPGTGTGGPGTGGGAPRSHKLGFGDKGDAWDNWED